MAEYIPSPREWVRDQVELYERSGGTEGTTLRDTGLPVIIVTHTGNQTGALRNEPTYNPAAGRGYAPAPSSGGLSFCSEVFPSSPEPRSPAAAEGKVIRGREGAEE